MPVSFTCPHCGLKTVVADQYAGQSGPCARCGQTITVPVAPSGPPTVPPPQPAGGTGAVAVVVVVVLLLLVCGGVAVMLPGFSSAGGYVMIVGEGTFGNKPKRATQMADIRDGTSNTIAVVEVCGLGIGWTDPKDLTVDELLGLSNNPNNTRRMSRHPGGFNAALADGSVRFIPETVDRETLRRLPLTSDGLPVVDY